MTLIDEIKQLAHAQRDEVIGWRRWMHRHPELSQEEYGTMAFVAERLREMGLEPKTGIGRTGVMAMLRGGIEKLADARLENVIRLRRHGFTQHVTLLRIPMLSQAKRVVEYCDCSLNSEIEVIREVTGDPAFKNRSFADRQSL